ncbi:MAG: hypothetical protein ACK4TN_00495 [Brevinematales bacterium]
MVSLLYTFVGNLHIAFLSEEIEQIVELNKTMISRQSLENIRMHHIAYKEKWYPLFDLQKIFSSSESLPVRYSMMIKGSQNTIICGICTPNPIEEISIPENHIYPFPAFLLQKQDICLLYALVQFQDKDLFLCSLSDIWHPITVAQYLLKKTFYPQPQEALHDTNR